MSHTDSILIVDDDPRFCESLEGLLSDQGYKMQTSNSGKEAVECLAKNSFNLVLLDIVLPDMDGHKIMDYINSQSPETLVIVITGYASIESAIESLRRGGYDYLRKPLEPDELSITVKNALNKKRLERENKAIQGKLALKEELYRYLVDNSPDIVYILDREGRFTFVNDAIEPILGFGANQLIGNHYTSIVFEEDLDKAKYNFNERRTGKRAAVSTELRLKFYHNGDDLKPSEKKHLAVELKAMGMYERPADSKDKKFTGTYGVGRDISARRQAEEALLLQSEITANMSEGVYLTRVSDGVILYTNPRVEQIFGYGPGEMVGKPASIVNAPTDMTPQETVDHIVGIMKQARVWKGEIQNIKKDGTPFWCYASASIFEHPEYGEIIVSVHTDINEHKLAKEEKKKLETRLQQAQKMEAIATLAGGIAHEFNNTLVGITGNIDLLQIELPDNENISKYAERMKDSTHRMAHLTNQLLAYARGGKYQPKYMSLSEFVEETLPLIKKTIDPSIHIEMDLPDDILNVEADLTQMQLVVSAVLNNSAEAIEGEGRIRITTNNEEIIEEFAKTHPGLKPGPYACLTIEDNGKGMDEETRSRIFEPFFTTKFRGRGLGMAAVYGIVKNHSGWISVDSQLGKGTVVRIYLPAIVPLRGTQARRAGLPGIKIQVEEKERPRIEPTKGEGTILVIEDEDIVINVVLQMLERLGYRILLAKTGKEAINIARSFDGDIDLALLDIVLPDLTGKEAYSRIMEARPNLKVIVCSGYTIDGPPQEVLDIGAQGFIQKPFSYATLSEKLKEVLEGK